MNAQDAANRIWSNLTGRRGIGSELEMCEEGIQQEIREKIEKIIQESIDDQTSEACENQADWHLLLEDLSENLGYGRNLDGMRNKVAERMRHLANLRKACKELLIRHPENDYVAIRAVNQARKAVYESDQISPE